MAIRGLLTKEEKTLMENYIDTNVPDANGRRSADIDYILREWASAKSRYLLNMMQGQLIVSEYIEYNKGKDQLATEIWSTMFGRGRTLETDSKCKDFYNEFSNKVIQPFRENWDTREIGWALENLMGNMTLATNEYTGQDYNIPLPNGKVYKLSAGCRATRAIDKLSKAFEVEGFEHFRIIHSQILNQKKLEGELCISIHPMDYMTMSDNDCDWESCMSWKNCGCYRQGTVEMMNSPMVVVAYLKAKTDMHPVWNSDETWNNKKWRELYIVTPDVITNVKGYPYCNEALSNIVLTKLKSMMEKAGLGAYEDKVIEYSMGSRFDHPTKEGETLKFDFYTNYMYNDFGDEHYAYVGKSCPTGNLTLTYSGESECMLCGDLGLYLDDGCEGYLCCDNCETRAYCYECNDRISNSDDVYYIDGQTLCSYCVDEYCFEDSIDGEYHLRENMLDIYVADIENRKIFSGLRINLYEPSYGKHIAKEYFNGVDYITVGRGWQSYHIVDYHNLTEAGKELFDLPVDEEEFMEEIKYAYSINFDFNF